MPQPGADRSRVGHQDDRQIGSIGAAVDRIDELQRYAVAALQNQRRGDVAITQDEPPGLERRPELGVEVVVPVGHDQTGGPNLGTVGVKTGYAMEVVVTDQLATSTPRIWAAGDVTGHPEFVYVAASHGTMVVDNAFTGADRSVDYTHLPRVTFTSPALGAVGMTDEQAVAAGIRCDCRLLPLSYVPRALVNRDTRGFIKVVADAGSRRVLGITTVAKDAGELAAAGVLTAGMTVEQVAGVWAPYLTMAEGIKIACQSYTTDISKLSCCAS